METQLPNSNRFSECILSLDGISVKLSSEGDSEKSGQINQIVLALSEYHLELLLFTQTVMGDLLAIKANSSSGLERIQAELATTREKVFEMLRDAGVEIKPEEHVKEASSALEEEPHSVSTESEKF